jgi:hydrophobic/amphiphilic exporter-1 (mainly G- bacteria), HAE1 family
MISKIAVKRPITTLMIVLILIGFGIASLTNLKLELFPALEIPVILVVTELPGASSTEVLDLVTIPIETGLSTVSNLRNIFSETSNGMSFVVLEFEEGTDIDMASLDVRDRMSIIERMLPSDIRNPIITQIDPNALPVLNVNISSDQLNLLELKSIVDNNIVPNIERQEGVASVNVSGGLETEIRVVLIEDSLIGHNLTPTHIAQALATENRNVPIGNIQQGDQSMSIRVSGELLTVSDIENLPITTPAGAVIPLIEVATVSEVFRERTSLSYTDGVPSISLAVNRQSTANIVDVSDNVLEEIESLQNQYPQLNIQVTNDSAEFIRVTLSNVTNSALIGGFFAIVVLLFFLNSIKSTIIISLAIPISIIPTFILMHYANLTINVMSLGGLALGIGMLVDNSIVVLENIYRKLEEGEEPKSAAINGAKEVSLAVVASTLTTISVFLPMVFTSGMVSNMFYELGLTVAFSLTGSLLVALTFVPMLCSVLLKPGKQDTSTSIITAPLRGFSKFIDYVKLKYESILKACFRKPKTTFLITFVLFLATLSTLTFLNAEFIPAADEGRVRVVVNMPNGTLIEEVERTTNEVLALIEQDDYITSISHNISNNGVIDIRLVAGDERSLTSDEMAYNMNLKLANIPGAEITATASAASMGAHGGGGVTVSVFGDDIETLTEISEDITTLLSNIPGTTTVTTSLDEVTTEASVIINRLMASFYGIQTSTITNILGASVGGSVATTINIDGEELDVRVQTTEESLNFIPDIENILIPTARGTSIPLKDIAHIQIDERAATISRENQRVALNINVGVAPGFTTGEVMSSVSEALEGYMMPTGYSWQFAGAAQEMVDAFTSLVIALIMAILLVYMIMAAQFESFLYPFIVMFSIPLALTGGMLGLLLTNTPLSVTSFLGFIMLTGIVINNAIVLIDYINELIRTEKLPIEEAILKAGTIRLRPILMASLTTILGLIPMMFSTSEGAELMQGLAIVVIFGLTISTFITLLLIPTVYFAIEIKRDKIKEKRALKGSVS